MSTDRRIARIAVAALAVAPLAAVAGFFRDQVPERPELVLVGVITWEVALFVLVFIGRVYDRLQERWVDRVADLIDLALRRTVSRYPRRYRYVLSRMHHDVDLRGLNTWGMYALAMDDVFVDLTLMPRAPHQVPTGPVGDQEQSAQKARVPVDATRRSIWEMLDRYSEAPLAILGPPGSGKTTLLRHVMLVLCRHSRHHRVPRRWRRKVPVLLFLREHVPAITSDPKVTLSDLVQQTFLQLMKREPPDWLERQLDKGRCVVMLDGLDEVARRDDRAVVMKWVRQQVAQYPRSRFIVTSRPFGLTDDPLASATVVQVRQFTDAQVDTFVRSWYLAVEQRSANRKDVGVRARAEEGAEKLLGRLYASPALLAFAANPLLLTMIASVHKYRAALPGSRAELYREICQVFLGKRQESKGLSSDLSVDQKSLVLQGLAFAMMERRVRDISAPDAGALVAPLLARVSYGGAPADFLVEMEQTSGLLIEREHNVYAFAHLTFQEYLTALHIAEKKPIDYLVRRIHDPWWREVTLLRVASTDATPVVRAALDSDPLTTELLSLMADCVEQAREVDLSVKQRVAAALSPASWQRAPDRRRLAAQVLLTRKLRHVIRGKMGIFICTEPVTNAEFRLFLQDVATEADDLRPPAWDRLPPEAEDQPVAGVGPQAAGRFVEWARALGINARLPAELELTEDDCRLIEKAPPTHFWTESERRAIHRVGLAHIALQYVLVPRNDSPLAPPFLDLLYWLMGDDAALLGALIPKERASEAGLLIGDDGLVEDCGLTWLPHPDASAVTVDLSDEARFRAEISAYRQAVVRLLGDVAGERLSTPGTTDEPSYAMPGRYLAHAPRIATLMHSLWTLGPGGARVPSSELSVVGLSTRGTDPLSNLVRARSRVSCLGFASDFLELVRARGGMGSYMLRRGAYRRLQERELDRILVPLAQLYLMELYIQGRLPRREGILLVRE